MNDNDKFYIGVSCVLIFVFSILGSIFLHELAKQEQLNEEFSNMSCDDIDSDYIITNHPEFAGNVIVIRCM